MEIPKIRRALKAVGIGYGELRAGIGGFHFGSQVPAGIDPTDGDLKASIYLTDDAEVRYRDVTGAESIVSTPSFAKDVASAGGGSQTTNVLNIPSPRDGLYLVEVVVSAAADDSAVTVVCTFKDGANNATQTATLINAAHVAANGKACARDFIRVASGTALVITLTASAQSTTKVSAAATRVA